MVYKQELLESIFSAIPSWRPFQKDNDYFDKVKNVPKVR